MTLLILFGPPAVGKMTVAQHIAKRSTLRVFHNHMTVDLAVQFFEYASPGYSKLVYGLRHEVIDTCAKMGGPDLVFTYVFALDSELDRMVIESLVELVEKRGGRVCFAELEASLSTRVKRNRTPHRRAHKSVMNLDDVESFMRRADRDHLLNTDNLDGYTLPGEHMKLNNETLSPEDAAEKICAYFGFAPPSLQGTP